MSARSCLTIVLAAGEGTRMKSATPKVLHPVAGRPMIGHVLDAVGQAGAAAVTVVVGHAGEAVAEAVAGLDGRAEIAWQRERLGTGHAVLAAGQALERGHDDVLVVFGDTPLLEAEALGRLRGALADGAAVAVMGFRTERPAGYGRLIEKDGALVAIREEKDCSQAERAVTFCNGGAMALDGRRAPALLKRIGNANAKGEYYLTDIVALAVEEGLRVAAVEAAFENALGVNTRAELAAAEAAWQARRRSALMLDGVTMTAPETVFLSHDTAIGADALIEPHVVFGPGVRVEGGARIRAFSHLEGATVAGGAEIGPYARLRPGAALGERAKVGNFCEIKNTRVEAGAKVPHLSYVGDATVGAGANIGAGTITCNYDGFSKHHTSIGPGAFIGSNSSLVAPLTIGEGAYVASGSVITQDVPDEALAFGRARQATRPEFGRRLRERLAAAKK